MKVDKPAVAKYVRFRKKLLIAVSIVVLPILMVCLVFACLGYAAFWIISPAVAIGYIVFYAFYAMNVSMGTVIGFEATDLVVHLTTKRRTYTYDVKRGCVGIRTTKRKFIATFETQDSRDTFSFYRRTPFTKSYEEQFTPDEIAVFYPEILNMIS